jgi:uncharacterized protein
MDSQIKSTILLTGASGLLGKAICRELDQAGFPWKAVHHADAGWDAENGVFDTGQLRDCGAVIHLAGEPIANKRWSAAQKQKIRDSRVNGTRALCEAMARADEKPHTLICASAIGYYGDRGEELLTEISGPGQGYLTDVVAAWEAATEPARAAGIRVVNLRLGIVLSPEGGALKKMLPVFKLGLGGRLGNGRMWMSWIHLQDAAKAFVFALNTPELQGAINLCAPTPLRNSEFTRCLASELRKPAFFPAPAFAIKTLLGEMGVTLLLGSTRVQPQALSAAGFTFSFPQLAPCLRDLLSDQ